MTRSLPGFRQGCVADIGGQQGPTWKAEPPEPKVLLFFVPLVCPVASVMASFTEV